MLPPPPAKAASPPVEAAPAERGCYGHTLIRVQSRTGRSTVACCVRCLVGSLVVCMGARHLVEGREVSATFGGVGRQRTVYSGEIGAADARRVHTYVRAIQQ